MKLSMTAARSEWMQDPSPIVEVSMMMALVMVISLEMNEPDHETKQQGVMTSVVLESATIWERVNEKGRDRQGGKHHQDAWEQN